MGFTHLILHNEGGEIMVSVTMREVINRIPSLLNKTIQKKDENIVSVLERNREVLLEINEIVFVGSGTSLTSTQTAKKFVEKVTKLSTKAVSSNEFLHDITVYNPKALYIFASQTGTSTSTREGQNRMQKLGYLTFAITESPETRLAQEGNNYIEMGCEHEEYPTRTIGYTTTVFTSMLIGLEIAKLRNTVDDEGYKKYYQDAQKSIDNHRAVSDKAYDWLTFNKRKMLRSSSILFAGGGELFGVALEAALKIWEIPQIASYAYEIEEIMHGPNFGMTYPHCMIVLNDNGVDKNRLMSLARWVKDIFKNGFVIGEEVVNEEEDLKFHAGSDSFKFIEYSAATQILAYRLAEDGGRDLKAKHNNSVMASYFSTHDKKETE